MRVLLLSIQNTVKPFERHKQALLLLLVLLGLAFICFIGLKNQPAPGNGASGILISAVNEDKQADKPDEVQVLVPGYSVKELPVSLNNVNALKYGPDGRLYALLYDGHIYTIIDTDGDGVEDKAELWWGEDKPFRMPVGMVVSPEGVYVSSQNKVSLIKDTNNDGKGDKEIVLTKDWVKPFVYTGTTEAGVDAFGIAKDKDGSIFFALGTADFTRAYIIDSVGKSHYDINSERGTVLKLDPATGKREIYCTGTRFPVAMAFNAHGDLFATDQEGATWLPNGNPLDELLHIQKGRHYGFPPRHPDYLPDVIDEPSVFDYAPQHESTCGLHFNLPVNGGPIFGPEWTRGDAFVCAFSRGKIYRTRLVKTPHGYVAMNDVFAMVSHMTVDAAPSPQGDLVVATHAGPPDWGYGPDAKGRLFKIFNTNKQVPNPVMVWASKPDQVKVAFDKPLPKNYLNGLADKVKIEYGIYVSAGDRFEVWRPGYKAVENQRHYPRTKMGVKNVDLSADGKTLIINTFTHTQAVEYALTLPAFANDSKSPNSLTQQPVIDLQYNLNAVDISWTAGNQKWESTLPHLDLNVSNGFLKPTGQWQQLQNALNKPGKLTLKTKLKLYNTLHPNTQPESSVNYKLPAEDITLVLNSSEPVEIKAAAGTVIPSVKKGEGYETKVTFKQVEEKPYDLEISANTTRKFSMEAYYYTAEDSRLRVFQTSRFFAPWIDEIFPKMDIEVKDNPELAGGNWAKGKKLFFGEAICSTCHSVNGEGKAIGPDLSNLVFRDYTSVLRDIHDPSATINPDYVAHVVTLKNKKKYAGFISHKTDSVVIKDVTGTRTTVAMKNVASTEPLGSSLMPQGLDKMLGAKKMKDLLTYLLTTVSPAKLDHPFMPAVMPVGEVMNQLKALPVEGKSKAIKPFRILWVSGPKDHGPDEHDYPLQKKRWSKLLSMAEDVTVTQANAWPTQQHFDNADVVVFYWNYQQFNEENGKQLDAFQKKGGGLVYLHYAVDATEHPDALANRIGLAWKGGQSKFRHGRLSMPLTDAGKRHPVTKGFKSPLTFEDESYWVLTPGSRKIDTLLTSIEDGKPQPMVWVSTGGNGRVFASIMGHYNWTFDDPLFRMLLFRGISWAGHQPLDRFNDLVTMGARINK